MQPQRVRTTTASSFPPAPPPAHLPRLPWPPSAPPRTPHLQDVEGGGVEEVEGEEGQAPHGAVHTRHAPAVGHVGSKFSRTGIVPTSTPERQTPNTPPPPPPHRPHSPHPPQVPERGAVVAMVDEVDDRRQRQRQRDERKHNAVRAGADQLLACRSCGGPREGGGQTRDTRINMIGCAEGEMPPTVPTHHRGAGRRGQSGRWQRRAGWRA